MQIRKLRFKERNTILITGAPRTGKTEVARKLIRYLDGDYYCCETDIVRNIMLGRSVLSESSKIFPVSATIKEELSTLDYDTLISQSVEVIEKVASTVHFSHYNDKSLIVEGLHLEPYALSQNSYLWDLLNSANKGRFLKVFCLGTDLVGYYKNRFDLDSESESALLQSSYKLNLRMMKTAKRLAESNPNIHCIDVAYKDTQGIVNEIIHEIKYR